MPEWDVQDEGSVRGDEAREATVTVGVVAVELLALSWRQIECAMRKLTQ